jgi:hypothetical protein
MGLLDDAIREHLELKRLRGADPSEVIRQEREALGSSVRQAAAVPVFDEEADEQRDDRRSHHGGLDEKSHGEVHSALDEDGNEAPTPAGDAVSEGALRERDQAQPDGADLARMALDQETAEVDMQPMLGVADEPKTRAGDEAQHEKADPKSGEQHPSENAWQDELHDGAADERGGTTEEPGEAAEST